MGSQKFLEGTARAVQPGFYGSNRNFKHLRNLFIGGVLQVAQNNYRRVVLRETVEERNHMLRQNRATLMELFGEGINLLLCGDLGSQ